MASVKKGNIAFFTLAGEVRLLCAPHQSRSLIYRSVSTLTVLHVACCVLQLDLWVLRLCILLALHRSLA